MQGDVQYSKKIMPDGVKKIKDRPIALGEKSGHQHVVTGDVELFEYESRTFAAVGSDGAILQHIHKSKFTNYKEQKVLPIADHNPIPLKEGTYEFVIQNEYNPLAKAFEQVID